MVKVTIIAAQTMSVIMIVLSGQRIPCTYDTRFFLLVGYLVSNAHHTLGSTFYPLSESKREFHDTLGISLASWIRIPE